MSFTGSGTTSKKRLATANQQQPAVGFQKVVFAHKASAGATSINLNALATPPEMSANGFVNPSASTLTGAQLRFYRNNLKLWSSVLGDMKDYYNYTVASSGQINLLNYTASEGEIFHGTIDNTATTGVLVAGAVNPPATGTLAAGQTDFNVGYPFQVNVNSTTQMGGISVWRNGQLMVRNTNNASVTSVQSGASTGDYQEVDNGTGFGSIVRFNVADPDNAATIVVQQLGRVAPMSTPSLMAQIEALNGQVNNLATYVAAATGQSQQTVLGATPSNVDLQSFGTRVLTLEQNRARTDLANTWSAAQALPIGSTINGVRTDVKQYVAGTAYTNGTITFSGTPGGWTVSRAVFIPYQTTDGAWRCRFAVDASSSSATTLSFVVSGITFKTGFAQALSTFTTAGSTVLLIAAVGGGNGTVTVTCASAQTNIRLAGDVELDSKPTWAD